MATKQTERAFTEMAMKKLIVQIAEYVAAEGKNEKEFLLLEKYVRAKLLAIRKDGK